MHRLAHTLAGLTIGLGVALTGADELKIPVGSQTSADAGPLPARGMPIERVRAGWGEPATRHAPIGQPPITRWDYPEFSVYFEYEHVVHAVVRHRRADEPPTADREP